MQIRIFRLIVCYFYATVVFAQDQDAKPIEIYEEASIAEKANIRYPHTALKNGQEGWVMINFMVDQNGKAFEPSVVDSLGGFKFEEKALEALSETKFNPATSSGNPVASSKLFKVTFRFEGGANYAREKFTKTFNAFINSIYKNNREKSEKILNKLVGTGAKSLYEEAYLNTAKYYFSSKYGNSEEQMQYLSKALYFDNEETYETFLPEKLAKQLWPRLFILEVNNSRYAEALGTYNIIQQVGEEDIKESLKPTVGEIEKIRKNNTPYKITARTNDYGSWHVILLKNKFYLDKVESNIEEIKLRCEKKYIFFDFDPNTQYKVSEDVGECNLEILGDANTSFELVQL